eukprot:scaffold516430_cov18-Prasinocladus_malaysianus.AAC.1
MAKDSDIQKLAGYVGKNDCDPYLYCVLFIHSVAVVLLWFKICVSLGQSLLWLALGGFRVKRRPASLRGLRAG